MRFLSAVLGAVLIAGPAWAGDADWVAAMKEVHAKNKAEKGSVSQIGDSITYTKAFLAGLAWKNRPISKPSPTASTASC